MHCNTVFRRVTGIERLDLGVKIAGEAFGNTIKFNEGSIAYEFEYTVVSLDESQVLGCLYIEPSKKADFDAEIYMWVRQSEVANGLDSVLFNTVKKWIDNEWTFKNPAYPIREISLEKWMSMK